MNRGSLVTIALPGDFGKPRPALVMQSDAFAGHSSIMVLPLSFEFVDAPLMRFTVLPEPSNGLRRPSQVMVDRAMTVRRERVGSVIGRLDGQAVLQIERLLGVFLGIQS